MIKTGPAPTTATHRPTGPPIRPPITSPTGTTTADKLLDAALVEFATHGFDAASTRAIATRAGVHQPQINYHFSSKEALWRATVDRLFAELATALAPALADVAADEPRTWMTVVVRGFVCFAAAHPELNRIMVHEAMADSDRLRWIVDTHVRPGFELLTGVWAELRHQGDVPDIDETVFYYVLVGAASLLYVNAAEARLLGHVDPTDPAVVDAHAEVLVRMLLPEPPARRARSDRTDRTTPT